MQDEIINRVSKVLQNPIQNRNELKVLVYELCDYSMNINCSSCITESVMLLSSWLKNNGIENEYKKRAINGEFELKKINLFVQVYDCGNEERQKELDACLRINKGLNINGVPYFNIIEIQERLTFNQMFALTRQYKDCINIIANSDIYFDETILYCRFMDKKDCWVLSRWDYKTNGMAVLFNRKDSQDVWVFNGGVNCSGGDFYLGTRGCDNAIAYQLKQSGYTVLNPSKSIHAIHLHNTEYRTYDEKSQAVPEPYHFIFPHY